MLLPASKQWQQLGILRAQDNSLTSISDELMVQFPVLYELILTGNKITVLPDFTPLASSLKDLDVSQNNISEINEHLSSLVNLETLDLSNNYIDTFPTSIIESLPKLNRLSLSGNKMKSFGLL